VVAGGHSRQQAAATWGGHQAVSSAPSGFFVAGVPRGHVRPVAIQSCDFVSGDAGTENLWQRIGDVARLKRAMAERNALSPRRPTARPEW